MIHVLVESSILLIGVLTSQDFLFLQEIPLRKDWEEDKVSQGDKTDAESHDAFRRVEFSVKQAIHGGKSHEEVRLQTGAKNRVEQELILDLAEDSFATVAANSVDQFSGGNKAENEEAKEDQNQDDQQDAHDEGRSRHHGVEI